MHGRLTRIFGNTKIFWGTSFRISNMRSYFQSWQQKFRVVIDQQQSKLKQFSINQNVLVNSIRYFGGCLFVSGVVYVKYHGFGEVENIPINSKLHASVYAHCDSNMPANYVHQRYSVDSFEHKHLHKIFGNVLISAKQYAECRIQECEAKIKQQSVSWWYYLSYWETKRIKQELLHWKDALSVVESDIQLVLINSDVVFGAVDRSINDVITILVCIGCLNTLTDDEISFILAHELSHLFLHHRKKLELLLESLNNSTTDEQYESKVLEFYSVAREQEHEADELGVILARDASYDMPEGAASFFLKRHEDSLLLSAERDKVDPRLSTHPEHMERHSRVSQQVNGLRYTPRVISDHEKYVTAFNRLLSKYVPCMLNDSWRYFDAMMLLSLLCAMASDMGILKDVEDDVVSYINQC